METHQGVQIRTTLSSDECAQIEQADLPIQLRLAAEADVETIARLDADGFSMQLEDAREYVRKSWETRKDTTFVAELDGATIGKIEVKTEGDEAFYYGFVVAKELRGRGYGRQILQMMIAYAEDVLQKKQHSLEVAAKNSAALHLYRFCGFEPVRSIEYYAMMLR